ncbi:MAG: hypothetical protein WA667_30405, partial [Candidatus Nitrosopolaris sp.]
SIPPKVVSFTNLQNHSGIQVITPKWNLNEVANSAAPTPFNIAVPENTQVWEYTIPIQAIISTNSTIPKEFIGAITYHSNVPTESFTTPVAELTVKVLEPLSFREWFKEGWDSFNDPLVALKHFKAGLYELELELVTSWLDIIMPQMDGFELYDKLTNIEC